jgi:hypothetical protein
LYVFLVRSLESGLEMDRKDCGEIDTGLLVICVQGSGDCPGQNCMSFLLVSLESGFEIGTEKFVGKLVGSRM